MTERLSSDDAIIAGLFVQAVLYGVFAVTFYQTVLALLWQDRTDQRNRDNDVEGDAQTPSSTPELERPKRKKVTSRVQKPTGIRIATLFIATALWLNGTLNLALGLVRVLWLVSRRTSTGRKGMGNWIELAKVCCRLAVVPVNDWRATWLLLLHHLHPEETYF